MNNNRNRLKKVLEFIDPNAKLADVGCDHGYLAIEAIKKGVSFVQLIDNKEGPLQSAINNLKYYEKESEVIYSLSSGLSKIHEKVDTVAICGMGGELIAELIDSDIDTAKKMKRLILQPNSKISFLRKYLLEKKFNIDDESIILDKGKTYEIIVCHYVGLCFEYNEKDYIFGPILRMHKNELFVNKWENKILFNNEILSSHIDEDKKELIEKENNLIKEVLYEN